MTFIVDLANNTLIDDEPKKESGKLNPKQYKEMMQYLVKPKQTNSNEIGLNKLGQNILNLTNKFDDTSNVIPDRPVRKPNAVPPKTKTIKKFKIGGDVKKEDAKKIAENVKQEVIQLASERNDPDQVLIDITPDIMQQLQEEYDAMVETGYKGSLKDYLYSKIRVRKNMGGSIKKIAKERTPINNLTLASAMRKISDATSGIGGIIARSSLSEGGNSNKPKEPKLINLSDYFRVGISIADLTPQEREEVNALLQKMLKGSEDN